MHHLMQFLHTAFVKAPIYSKEEGYEEVCAMPGHGLRLDRKQKENRKRIKTIVNSFLYTLTSCS